LRNAFDALWDVKESQFNSKQCMYFVQT